MLLYDVTKSSPVKIRVNSQPPPQHHAILFISLLYARYHNASHFYLSYFLPSLAYTSAFLPGIFSSCPTDPVVPKSSPITIYTGPLTTVARRLKLFSFSSLALTLSACPLIFIADVPLPTSARVVLVSAGMRRQNSSCSREPFLLSNTDRELRNNSHLHQYRLHRPDTIHWALSPYVTRITIPLAVAITPLAPITPLTLHTLSLMARETQNVVELGDLVPSERVFTTWAMRGGKKKLFYVHPEMCGEGIVREVAKAVESAM